MNRLLNCYLYALVAPAEGSLCHFKIGISTDPLKRFSSIQTGCPVPISEMIYVEMGLAEVARLAEKELHARFSERRTTGEWFIFDTAKPADKQAFNGTMREVMAHYLGSEWRWSRISAARVAEVARREQAAATRKARAATQERRRRWFAALRKGRHHAY